MRARRKEVLLSPSDLYRHLCIWICARLVVLTLSPPNYFNQPAPRCILNLIDHHLHHNSIYSLIPSFVYMRLSVLGVTRGLTGFVLARGSERDSSRPTCWQSRHLRAVLASPSVALLRTPLRAQTKSQSEPVTAHHSERTFFSEQVSFFLFSSRGRSVSHRSLTRSCVCTDRHLHHIAREMASPLAVNGENAAVTVVDDSSPGPFEGKSSRKPLLRPCF